MEVCVDSDGLRVVPLQQEWVLAGICCEFSALLEVLEGRFLDTALADGVNAGDAKREK